MLPDLPLLKKELQDVLRNYLDMRVHSRLGVFAEAPRHIIHEGSSMRIIRADGSVEDSEMQPASAEMTIDLNEIPSIQIGERIQKIDLMAEKMAEQMSKHMFKSLDATLDRAGQVTDQKGRPFDAESILEALDSIHIEFDESGHHSPLTLVTHPDMGGQVSRAFESLELDPSLRARYEALMQRKRAEYRDREIARKLVG